MMRATPGLVAPIRTVRLPDMGFLSRGRYRARFSRGAHDIRAARALRSIAFDTDAPDCDRFDRLCDHLLIRDRGSGALVCCARLLHLPDGTHVADSYSAQYYELGALAEFRGAMAEVGRFCIHPDWSDPDILRVAWGAMTTYVDENQIAMLFGCSSFAGTDHEVYLDSFAMLQQRHLAPERWLPGVKSVDVIRYGFDKSRMTDAKRALQAMPPLLRTYLMMGAWVSDHAVVDHRMNTLHVFTGLEIGAIPARRKRLLRMLAGQQAANPGVDACAAPE